MEDFDMGFHRWFRKSSIKAYLKELLPDSVIRKCVYIYNKQWQQKSKNMIPKAMLGFETHIVEHCNLNCSSCCHFSPLAKEEYLDIKVFEKDCERIAQLTKELRYLRLLGGEPLLHPGIIDFFEVARKYFRDTKLQLTTNGVLLSKMPDSFWESCMKNKVEVNVTDYPINIHFEKVVHWKERGVNLNYNPSIINATNSFHFSPIDVEGKQDGLYNFQNCQYPNDYCITLRDGKLYTCCILAHAKIFNEYFNQNLEITANDYIDIYKAKDIQEILNFLCKPIPFCKYCNVKKFVYGIKWYVSKKEISEWTFER
jgi:MoaA/NifB/PqqE/SkfB family radical SAM enzyme